MSNVAPMHAVRQVRTSLYLSAFVAILAACSGGNASTLAPVASAQDFGGSGGDLLIPVRSSNSVLDPTVGPIRHWHSSAASFMEQARVGTPLVFISDIADDTVKIYSQGAHARMVGSIGGFQQPQGLTTDARGNLYVANTNASNVLVFAPPYTKGPALTLPDPGEFPTDVAVSMQGLIAVTNICSAPACTPESANVMFFKPGSRTPCATVSNKANLPRIAFAAFDRKGNLYVDGTHQYLGDFVTSFGVANGGCTAKHISWLQTLYNMSTPGSVQVDTSGRVGFVDQLSQSVVTFNPAIFGDLPYPYSIATLLGSHNVVSTALLPSGKELYSADAKHPISYEYEYPAGSKPTDPIVVGGTPIGVAVTPVEQPGTYIGPRNERK